ncbi:MAG TPA: DUF503 domain-containing protein [Nitrolancea sp.]|jgi:uncharacterized protein YlxP (DUF503 family)|nr:DUF503 domain-containing protein [Nitrolancea sp.]
MPMILGTAQLTLHIPAAQSLKDRRRVVKSIMQRVRNRFDVAIADIDEQQQWQAATLGIVAVANSSRHVETVVQQVINFVEENIPEGYVADVRTDVLHLGD